MKYLPGTIAISIAALTTRLERQSRLLEIHLREIANNERYQHHKGIIKARRREIESMRQLLDLIDQALGSEGA